MCKRNITPNGRKNAPLTLVVVTLTVSFHQQEVLLKPDTRFLSLTQGYGWNHQLVGHRPEKADNRTTSCILARNPYYRTTSRLSA